MRAILQNVASVIGGEAVVRVANYAAVLFIARFYGATTLGAYAVTLSVITVVVMFADAGLQTAAITQLSREDSNRSQIFSQFIFCKISLLFAAALLLALYVGLFRPGLLFISIGAWLALRAALQSMSQLQLAALKSISKATFIGAIQSAHGASLFLGLWFAFRFTWSLAELLAWLSGAQLLELLLAVVVLILNGVHPRWPRPLQLYAILQAAAPFGIAYGTANLIVRSDTIILSKFVSLPELGSFSAANSLLLLVYVASSLFGSILLPEMVRILHHGDDLRSWSHLWVRRVALLSIPAALLASLAAPKLIVALFGPAYSASGLLASLMLLACPLILVNSIYTTFAIAANRRVALLSTYAAAALVSVSLDFALARAFGSRGVAAAIVIREAAMLLTFWSLTSRVPSPAAKLRFRPSPGGN